MPENTHLSRELFAKAQRYFPGGVNSPVRSFVNVGGDPLFIIRGRGSRIWDADGNEYIDYVCSWGPLILGHAHPEVVRRVKEAADRGTSFGAPTPSEVELARLVLEAVPSMEMVRFVSSGTEAVMSALRLARGYTGRSRILKFEGCYHGHVDSLLVKAGSGAATHGVATSAGVTPGVARDTLVAPYNDLVAVERLFKRHPEGIAAVIVEPVAANMGVVLPGEGFLQGLRQLTSEYGALLIFDEVITGFRVAYGGAQELYGVKPDITCLGKVIGGGLPVGAYGGRREIMSRVSPLGLVYQAGTLSGNPMAMAAGVATLKALQVPGVYQQLEERGAQLAEGLKAIGHRQGIALQVSRVGSLLSIFFTAGVPGNWQEVEMTDAQRYASFFWGMLGQGVYLAPSPYEAAFLSLAHSQEDVQSTLKAAEAALQSL